MTTPSHHDPIDVAASYPDPPETPPDAGSPSVDGDILARLDGSPSGPAEVVLSTEQLTAGTEWTVSGSVRFRRHIAAYTRTVDVVVRREELQVEVRDVADHHGAWIGTRHEGPAVPAPVVPPAPGVFVLREEVPEVVLSVRPYERVTVQIDRVVDQVELSATRRHEQAAISGDTGSVHPPVRAEGRRPGRD